MCALPGGDTGLSPHLCCFVPAVLQGAEKDKSSLVSSLATQTALILESGGLKPRSILGQLRLLLQRARKRWHSAPSEVSAQAETKQQP